MIRSDNFAFVHVPRTGGWSLTHALRPVTKKTGKHHEPLPNEPLPWTFGFVRNPWDRLVSLWASKWNIKRQAFPEWFFDGRLLLLERFPHVAQLSASYWLVNEEREVDTIYRFEDLHEAWADIQKRIGFSAPLLHYHKLTHPPYQEVHTPETFELIREACSWEIERFNYCMDHNTAAAPTAHRSTISPCSTPSPQS